MYVTHEMMFANKITVNRTKLSKLSQFFNFNTRLFL
jgi:hypothetical protein